MKWTGLVLGINRTFITTVFLICVSCDSNRQGKYFSVKDIQQEPLPSFQSTKPNLPDPIFDEYPTYVECYWKAWEIAFNNFYQPTPENGFVSNYIDAAFTFNNNIYFWDTGFMTMFCNYAHPYVPGIQSMDNFYAKQHPDGEICREIVRETGEDYKDWVNHENRPFYSRYGDLYAADNTWEVKYVGREVPTPKPVLTLDAMNHPIAGWIELESYYLTGDKDRLELVWEPLVQYYNAFQKYLQQGNGLYITDWASMDNSPRNIHLKNGGCGIDISAEMVMFAKNLSEIAAILGKSKQADIYNGEATELTALINDQMWDEGEHFYFDLTVDNKRIPIMTIAAFWPLLAGVASDSQAEHLAVELRNPLTFNRPHRVPTLSAAEDGYDPYGGYWKGAVWAPTVTMVIRGLENYGMDELANEIAINHLSNVVKVYEETGTIWENYAPDTIARGNQSLDNFVGWSGIAPILYLIEYAIGIKANAPANTINWKVQSLQRVGINNFLFGGKTISLVCESADEEGKRKVRVQGTSAFELVIDYNNKTTRKHISTSGISEFIIE